MAQQYDPTRYDPIAKRLNVLKESFSSREDVPADVVSAVEELLDVSQKRENYLDLMATQPSENLVKIRDGILGHDWKGAHERGDMSWVVNVHMSTNPVEAQFLKSLIASGSVKRVLEVGMFCGYGTMAMAEALPEDGVIVTCDVSSYFETITRKNFEGTGHEKKLRIMIGAALDSMNTLISEKQSFDLIFVDADKDNYPNYYQAIMDSNLLADKGVIVFDNALWGGTLYSGEIKSGTEAIQKTNQLARNDDRVHHVILPIRDGIMLVRRKADWTGLDW